MQFESEVMSEINDWVLFPVLKKLNIVHVICTEKLYWRKSTIKWLIFEEMAIAVTHPKETSASYRYLNVFTAWNFLSMLDLDDT